MFTKTITKNHHPKIRQQIHAINLIDDGGVCFGYAMMAAQAVLLGDTHSFDRRMTVLYELPADELTKKMETAFAPPQPGGNAAANAKKLFYIDMQAFLSGITLYQNLRPYRYLFNVGTIHLKQNASMTARIVLPQKLIDQGGLVEADSFYGVYNYFDLNAVLHSLRDTLRKSKIAFPVAFVFKSSNHALTLGFDPRCDKWLFQEVHHGTTQFPEETQIAEMVNQAFSENTTTAVTVSAYTAGKNAEKTKSILAEWKQSDIYKNAHAMSIRRIESADSDQTTLLYLAVLNNDVRRVTNLLKSSHVKVNQLTNSGLSALHYAIIAGHIECVKLLLAHPETDVNLRSGENDFTPLHIAVGERNLDVCRLLLQHKKIDINAARKDGTTALHGAACTGQIALLKKILKMPGLNVNAETISGMTALHYAVQENEAGSVEVLLQHPEIDIDKAGYKKATALMLAAAGNRLDIAKLILEKFPGSARTSIDDLSAIEVAQYNHHQNMVNLLHWFAELQPSPAFCP